MMKIKWIVVLAVLFPLLGSAEEGATLVCDEPIYNFGEIYQTTIVTNVFTIRNTGDLTFLVKRVYASCSCTKGKIDKKVIEPGETAQVTAIFNSSGRMGAQKRSLRIMSSTSYQPALKLFLNGAVKLKK